MHYIGLMSGTSLDGVDAVLAAFPQGQPPQVLAHASLDIPQALRRHFLALNTPGPDELARAALAGNDLARLYARAIRQVLDTAGFDATQIRAVGAHGQTVRHQPDQGYTIQVNSPALLAELSGIAVIADFRSRDVAAGGQGAPLAPMAHQALFAHTAQPCVILNLGGMANITLLDGHQPLSGFDTGPANVLLDSWTQQKLGQPFDKDGAWAATGAVNQPLLDFLIASEPWFTLPPPKSTGRHLFNEQWLHHRLAQALDNKIGPFRDQDVQATLVALTASSAGEAISRHAPDAREVICCGGGAHNTVLLQALQNHVPPACRVTTSQDHGIPAQQVEALAFAWLAWAWEHGVAAGQPSVTGARAPRLLGGYYPA